MTQTATPKAGPTTASNVVMSHRQILLVIYGLMAGMFLGALDQTIVGTAIRTIGDDLHGLDQQAWVTTGYLIASTITTPIYGKLSDIFGRRPLFIIAIGIFIVGSFAASFSTSMIMLAGFRALQGLGAGGLMSLPLAIMGDMLAPRDRAKYQGYFLAVFGVSSVIGPLIGGLFAGAHQIAFIAGWRWVFLINVPIGIVALVMVLMFLHLPKVAAQEKPRIDWWGAALVVVTLGPLLLIAEQGRTWGWGSVGAIICYVVGAVGLILFIIVERAMKDDAILPLKLFNSKVFSMSAVLSILVGFGMFGAMLTLPLYLQIVKGITPTESGFAMLPMVLGLMIATITSGQIISKTGNYRVFPITGTAFTAVGFLLLTLLTADRPLWFLMIAMFVIGLGLGQLMQTLTLAAQNSVAPRDMGVATSASTFFRQIGGTLGTAVLLSVLFSVMPVHIQTAMQNRSDLSSALNAALTPSVAKADDNSGVMKKLWNPVVKPIKTNIQSELDKGAKAAKSAADAAVTKQVTAAVQAQVTAGQLPATQAKTVIQQQVASALPAAEKQALQAAAKKAKATVDGDTLRIDYANATQRRNIVDNATPTIIKQLKKNDSKASSSTSDTSDTSFLDGADSRLTRPFLVGFTTSAVIVYWVGLGVILLAFILTWFFRVPPLRQVSALQEQADTARRLAAADDDPRTPGAAPGQVPASAPSVLAPPASASAPAAAPTPAESVFPAGVVSPSDDDEDNDTANTWPGAPVSASTAVGFTDDEPESDTAHGAHAAASDAAAETPPEAETPASEANEGPENTTANARHAGPVTEAITQVTDGTPDSTPRRRGRHAAG